MPATAGVDHAAPQYLFGDRAGLLTAVAATGYRELAAAVDRTTDGGNPSVADLGRTYVDFGLANLALFDLMFSPGALHPHDSELQAAQAASLVLLRQAVSTSGADPSEGDVSILTMASWTFAHGIVELLRNGALQALTGQDDGQLRDRLVEVFDAIVATAALDG